MQDLVIPSLARIFVNYFLASAFYLELRKKKFYDFKIALWITLGAYLFATFYDRYDSLLNSFGLAFSTLVLLVLLVDWLINVIFKKPNNLWNLLIGIVIYSLGLNAIILIFSSQAITASNKFLDSAIEVFSLRLLAINLIIILIGMAIALFQILPIMVITKIRFKAWLNNESKAHYYLPLILSYKIIQKVFITVFYCLAGIWILFSRGVRPSFGMNYFLLAFMLYLWGLVLPKRNILFASLLLVVGEVILDFYLGQYIADIIIFLLFVILIKFSNLDE